MQYDKFSFVLSQNYFGYWDLMWFYTSFRILCSSSVKNVIQILVGITVLTMLILLLLNQM